MHANLEAISPRDGAWLSISQAEKMLRIDEPVQNELLMDFY